MKRALLIAGVFGMPLLALAQAVAQSTDIPQFLNQLISIFNVVLGFVVLLAGVIFVVGLVRYISGAGDEETQKSARSTMIWGIIIIFVMLSLWGLVGLLTGTFGLDVVAPQQPPILPPV